MDEQRQLREWAIADGIDPGKIRFDGYDFTSKGVLGYCLMDKNGVSHIHLNKGFEDHPILAKATLWHEYCHAWGNDDGTEDGHSSGFWSHYFGKPWYFLIYLVSGFVL